MNGEALEAGSQTLANADINDGTFLDVVLQPVAGRQAVTCRSKVACIGASTVGKSALIAHFTGASYSDKPTVGIDFSSKLVQVQEHKAVRLQLWDISTCTAGNVLAPIDADAVIVIYDITKRASFNAAWDHLKHARGVLGDRKPVLLIGNKADRTEYRVVTEEEGEGLAKEFCAFFAEASASTGSGVSSIFHHLAEKAQDANEHSDERSANIAMNRQGAGLACSDENSCIQSVHGETQEHFSARICKQAAAQLRFGLAAVALECMQRHWVQKLGSQIPTH